MGRREVTGPGSAQSLLALQGKDHMLGANSSLLIHLKFAPGATGLHS